MFSKSKFPKVLIFSTKIGGGHESAAKEIFKQIQKQNPKFEIRIVYPFSENFFISENFLASSYNILVSYLESVWLLFCFLFEIPFLKKILYKVNKTANSKIIKKYIQNFDSQIIFSTYYFFGIIGAELFPEKQFYTFVCDNFTPHSIWFFPSISNKLKNHKYIVLSSKAENIAQNLGISKNNIIRINPIVKSLDSKINSGLIQKNFSLEKRKTIFILAGGDNYPGGFKIIKKLINNLENKNLIIVCGRNRILYKRVLAELKSFDKLKIKNLSSDLNLNIIPNSKNENNIYRNFYDKSRDLNVILEGFSKNILEIMSVSDLLICKGGPATVLEGVSLNIPIIVTSIIRPQESGNAEFLEENNLGYFIQDSDKVLQFVTSFFNPKNNLKNSLSLNSKFKLEVFKGSLLEVLEKE